MPEQVVKRPGDLRVGKGVELISECGAESPQATLEISPMLADGEDEGRVPFSFQEFKGIEGLELNLPVVDASQCVLQTFETFNNFITPVGAEEPTEELQEVPQFLTVNTQAMELGSENREIGKLN